METNVYAVSPGRYLTLAIILWVPAYFSLRLALHGTWDVASHDFVAITIPAFGIGAILGVGGVWCLRQAAVVWWQNIRFFWGPR